MAPAGIDAIVAKAQARFGAIDGWVNNAGSAHPDDVWPMLDIAEGQWYRVVDLNLKWTFFAMQAAARAMAARSEEHTSELQSLMRTSYAVCCLKLQRTRTFIYLNERFTPRSHTY